MFFVCRRLVHSKFFSSSFYAFLFLALFIGVRWSTFFRLTNRYIQFQAKCLWLKKRNTTSVDKWKSKQNFMSYVQMCIHNIYIVDMMIRSQSAKKLVVQREKERKNFNNRIHYYTIYSVSKWTSLICCCCCCLCKKVEKRLFTIELKLCLFVWYKRRII